jgi:hypothetical protein
MASALETLLVRLDADTKSLRSALKDAGTSVDGYQQSVDRALSKNERRFQAYRARVARELVGFASQLAGGLGVFALINKASDALGEVAGLQKLAAQTGFTVEKLQELRFAFRNVIGDQAELGNVMSQFAERVAEVRAKTGELYDFLAYAKPQLLAQIQASKSQAEALDIVANAVAGLSRAEDRALLSKKAFGDVGKQLVSVLQGGAKAFDDAGVKTREIGVQSAEAARQAAEVNARYTELSFTLSQKFKTGVVGVVDWIQRSNVEWQDLMTRLKVPGKVAAPDTRSFLEQMTELAKKVPKLDLSPTTQGGDKLGEKPDYTFIDQLRGLQKTRLDLEGNTRAALELIRAGELEDFNRMLKAGKISSEQFAEARVQINAVAAERIAAEVKKELAPFRSVIESSLTEPLRDAFDGNLQSVSSYFRKLLAGFALAIEQALILKPLLNALENSFSGSKGVAGNNFLVEAFGNIFGGFRAEGGSVGPGRSFIVGERGPERFVPGVPGFILPNAGRGGGNVFAPVTNIDARNAEIGVADQVATAVAVAMEVQRRQLAAQASHRSRFPTRRD